MVERVRRVSRQALVLALVTLGTNAAQWAKAREERLRRDDLLASAIERNVRALDDARKVLEEALKTCAQRKGLPQVMLRESEPQVEPQLAPGDRNILTWMGGSTASAMLDQIAADEMRRRQSEVMALPGGLK